MAWTSTQRKVLMAAAGKAGWSTRQRYLVMLHCGCPLTRGAERTPSVSHPGNDHGMFERVMAVAERHAAGVGERVNPPRTGAKSWSDAAARSNTRMMRLVREIADEATRRAGSKFAPDFLAGFVQRMTAKDSAGLTMRPPPRTLEECDEGQVYRVLEGLRAWVGREFLDRGITPTTFTIPAHARAQHTRKHGAAA